MDSGRLASDSTIPAMIPSEEDDFQVQQRDLSR